MTRHATSQASHLFVMRALAEYIESEGLTPYINIVDPSSVAGIPAWVTDQFSRRDDDGGQSLTLDMSSKATNGSLVVCDDCLMFGARFRGREAHISISGYNSFVGTIYAKEFPQFGSSFAWGEGEAVHLGAAYEAVNSAIAASKKLQQPKPPVKKPKGNVSHLKRVK